MAIGAISSGAPAVTLTKPQPEQNEVHRAGRDAKNDGDGDDTSSVKTKATASAPAPAAAAPAPAPTVNTSGQAVGAVLNTKA
jgi:hypothetical protein